jgi:hypothetical protein
MVLEDGVLDQETAQTTQGYPLMRFVPLMARTRRLIGFFARAPLLVGDVGGGCGNGEERVEPEKPSFVSLGQAYLRSGQSSRFTYVNRNSVYPVRISFQLLLQLRFTMLAALLKLPRLPNTGGIPLNNQRAPVLKLLCLCAEIGALS